VRRGALLRVRSGGSFVQWNLMAWRLSWGLSGAAVVGFPRSAWASPTFLVRTRLLEGGMAAWGTGRAAGRPLKRSTPKTRRALEGGFQSDPGARRNQALLLRVTPAVGSLSAPPRRLWRSTASHMRLRRDVACVLGGARDVEQASRCGACRHGAGSRIAQLDGMADVACGAPKLAVSAASVDSSLGHWAGGAFHSGLRPSV